jgi:hypothetical protein
MTQTCHRTDVLELDNESVGLGGVKGFRFVINPDRRYEAGYQPRWAHVPYRDTWFAGTLCDFTLRWPNTERERKMLRDNCPYSYACRQVDSRRDALTAICTE